MGLWDGLDKAQTFERGTFIQAGTVAELKIANCLDKQTRKSGQAFIVEFEVVASSNPAHPAGSKVSWFQSMKDRDIALGAVKEFIAAVYGFNLHDPARKAQFEKEIAPSLPQIADAACASGYLNGKMIRVETSHKKTVGKGLDFTVHAWEPSNPSKPVGVMAPSPVAPAAPAAPSFGGLPGLPGVPR